MVAGLAELQEFVAQLLVRFVGAPPEGGPGGRLLLANAPHLHAEMRGVEVDRDPVGRENPIERVDDLASSRSCIEKRRAYSRTTRVSLESPMMRSCATYPIQAWPKKGKA